MRRDRFVARTPHAVADINQLVTASDVKAQFFVRWWRRMHQKPDLLVAVAMKCVEWTDVGASPQRFVWEVCEWPQGDAATWTFICWMLDGEGMWLKEFPSKQAAMDYYGLPPAVVMAGDTNVRDVAQHRRAS